MDPREERPAIISGKPCQCAVDNVITAPFGLEVIAESGVARDLVVIERKAAIQSEAVIENECADERARSVSIRREQRGQSRTLFRKRSRAVVSEAVMQRKDAGKNRRVRGQRQRNGAFRVLKTNAARSDGIDGRRRTEFAAV